MGVGGRGVGFTGFGLFFALGVGIGFSAAQLPDHPVITEVYTDSVGINDGPVARDPSSTNQEYIEIYLPTSAGLNPQFNKDSLRLTFYEVEGDTDSSGVNLINYRFDLPTFDLDSSNGITSGAIARPSSGVVLLGWVDYVGNPPTGLAGTPSTRVALIKGGITSTDGTYTFVAINGHHFTGTTNFPVLTAENLIDLPSEASSGVIQNGSGAYLLVNRDQPGYVQLCDDQHAGDCVSGAFPNLPVEGSFLDTGCLHDALAGNDDANFSVLDQPSPDGNGIDLGETLPPSGAFSLLTCQVPENASAQPDPGAANGYARRFLNVLKTTETASADDPVADAQSAYRYVRNNGPFYPTPGVAHLTTSPPDLGVALAADQLFDVLAQTTGRPAILSANTGGNYPINLSATGGASSNPAVASFGSGTSANSIMGQTVCLPSISITPAGGAAHLSTATSTVTVTATNTNGGDPPVASTMKTTTATATVLKPTTGKNAAGAPFQATVFVAVLPIYSSPIITNEFRSSSLGTYLAALPDITAVQTIGNGPTLINAATNIASGLVTPPMIDGLPNPGEECTNWRSDAGPPGRLSFPQTVVQSAENTLDPNTYLDSIGTCLLNTVIRANRYNLPDTQTDNGGYTPTEPLYFVDANGAFGALRTGLSNATTTRTFEIAIVDTNVRTDGTIESGKTDDFGLVIQVAATSIGSPALPGEFVFLSFTGGYQGVDIDPRLDQTNALLYVYLLDLDNLNTVLGITQVESVYVVDTSATGELDVIEVFSLGTSVSCVDTDGDGYGTGTGCLGPDCNDGNIAVNPGATEVCNDSIDNDCDFATDCADSACAASPFCCADGDGDGYGVGAGCLGPDCNDGNIAVNPGATEVCNDGLDNDCDLLTDCLDSVCNGHPACVVCGNTICESGETTCTCAADCGPPAGSEVVGSTCQDASDNDCDGLMDCQDSDCASDPNCNCANDIACLDDNACTCNRCVAGACQTTNIEFGNANCSANQAPNLDDILCTLAGFASFASCPNADIAPTTGPQACQGNGIISLDDILLSLAAFGGSDPCGCAP